MNLDTNFSLFSKEKCKNNTQSIQTAKGNSAELNFIGRRDGSSSIYESSQISKSFKSYIFFTGKNTNLPKSLSEFKKKLSAEVKAGKYGHVGLTQENLSELLDVLNESNIEFFEPLVNAKEKNNSFMSRSKDEEKQRFTDEYLIKTLGSINAENYAPVKKHFYAALNEKNEHDFYFYNNYNLYDLFNSLNDFNESFFTKLLKAENTNKSFEDKRFSASSIDKILGLLTPETQKNFDFLFDAKFMDGKKDRFYEEGIHNTGFSDIFAILNERYDSDSTFKKMFDFLYNLKNKSGNDYRFDGPQLAILIKDLNDHPEKYNLIKELLEETALDGKSYRFNAAEIFSLTEMITEDPSKQVKEAYNYLKESTATDETGQQIYRFNGRQINNLLRSCTKIHPPEAMKFFYQVIDQKSFDGKTARFDEQSEYDNSIYDLTERLQNINQPDKVNISAFDKIINATNAEKTDFRFNAYDISRLVSYLPDSNSRNMLKPFNELLDAKSADGKNYRFDANSISSLMYFLEKNSGPETFKYFTKLLNLKTADGKAYAFNTDELQGAVEFFKENNCNEVKRALSILLKSNTAAKNSNRFTGKNILEILQEIVDTKNSDIDNAQQFADYKVRLLNKLVKARTVDQKSYRFDHKLLNILKSVNPHNSKFLETLYKARMNDKDHYYLELDGDKDISQLFGNDIAEDQDISIEADIKGHFFDGRELDHNTKGIAKIHNSKRFILKEGYDEKTDNGIKHWATSGAGNKIDEVLLTVNGKQTPVKVVNRKIYQFKSGDIGYILRHITPENEEIFKYIIQDKDTNRHRPRYVNSEHIVNILKTIDDNQLEFLKEIAEAPEHSSFSSKYKYDGESVAAMVKFFTKTGLPAKQIIQCKDYKQLPTHLKYQIINLYSSEKITAIQSLQDARLTLPVLPIYDEEIAKYPGRLLYSIYLFDNFKYDSKLVRPAINAINLIDDSIKNFDFDTYRDKTIPLKYSTAKFIEDAKALTANLSGNDKLMAQGYFGFRINPQGQLEDFPYPNRVNMDILEETANYVDNREDFLQAVAKLEKLVKQYTQENEFQIPESPELSAKLTVISKVFPEFLTCVGKKQHETHKYTLDIHQLKAVQEFINDPDYQSLSPRDKHVAKIAYLFHDIAKQEGEVDENHPQNSALVVYKMLKRVNYPEKTMERVFNLIDKHHWAAKIGNAATAGEGDPDPYNISEEKKEELIKEIVFDFRRPSDYKISRIFAKADLKAVGGDFANGKMHVSDFFADEIQQKLHNVHNTGIYLPQSNIPKASKIPVQPAEFKDYKGTTHNTVVDMNQTDNFEELGFPKGTTRDNFYTLIHAVEQFRQEDSLKDFEMASKEGQNGVFSTSYISLDTIRPYSHREVGFVLEVDPNNIALALNRNLGSGGGKQVQEYKNFLMEDHEDTEFMPWKEGRNAFSDSIKRQLKYQHPHLSDELIDKHYIDIYKKILYSQSLPDIKNYKIKDMVQAALKEVILNQGDNNNEVVAYAPKIKALFTLTSADKIDYKLRKFAEDNDLPILKFKLPEFEKPEQ